MLRNFGEKISQNQVPGLNRFTIPRKPKSFDDISRLCGNYTQLDTFLWLQEHFVRNDMEHQAALSRKEETVRLINEGLSNTDALTLNHCYLRSDRNRRRQAVVEDEEEEEDSDADETA